MSTTKAPIEPIHVMPRVCKPILQGGRSFSMLAPLAAMKGDIVTVK